LRIEWRPLSDDEEYDYSFGYVWRNVLYPVAKLYRQVDLDVTLYVTLVGELILGKKPILGTVRLADSEAYMYIDVYNMYADGGLNYQVTITFLHELLHAFSDYTYRKEWFSGERELEFFKINMYNTLFTNRWSLFDKLMEWSKVYHKHYFMPEQHKHFILFSIFGTIFRHSDETFCYFVSPMLMWVESYCTIPREPEFVELYTHFVDFMVETGVYDKVTSEVIDKYNLPIYTYRCREHIELECMDRLASIDAHKYNMQL